MEEVREPVLLQTLRGLGGEVACADAAGALLVTGGGDRALRGWRWAPARGWEQAACAPAAHRYGVTAARLAPGGALLASGGVDGVVRVWAARRLTPVRALAAPGAAAVRALCWAGRGRVLAGHDDGALAVWAAARGALLARLAAHAGALHAVAAPAQARLLLTACTDGVLKVFDLAEVCRCGAADLPAPAPLTWVDGAHDLGALCADASERGHAATGGHDALVRLWRARGALAGLAPDGALAGHAAAVTALRWARGGALLASAALDRTARVWAPAARACLHVLHAHARYLTCVALAHDARYMLTGSNDKSVRMWSLSTLTLEDELDPPCAALDHFALGDLEGIEPVEESLDEILADDETVDSGAQRVWHVADACSGPINSIATHVDLVATASSDGWVRLYRWCEEPEALVEIHALDAHQYPAMAVDFGVGGAILLSAGLDCRACLWDVESGVQLRVLSVGADESACGDTGGGGVRGARVSPHRPARLLLATDDGIAPLWSLDSAEPRPSYVFAGRAEALTCCAWARDGRVAVAGAAGGALLVLAPPRAAALTMDADAHDLGVQSCDFAPPSDDFELPEDTYLLATAGSDSFVKLWLVETQQEDGHVQSAALRVLHAVEAHGGGAACVRWGAGGAGGAGGGALLASAGADGWARVWRVAPGLRLRAAASVAAAAGGAGGALAVALLARVPPLLVAGALTGELTLWRLAPGVGEGAVGDMGSEEGDAAADDDDDAGAAPALWGAAGVARWLRENVSRAPGAQVTSEEEAELIRKSQEAGITGSRLLNAPVDELLNDLGYGNATEPEESSTEQREATRARLRDELAWLRREPPPAKLERGAPHALLCPLSHRLLVEPARAADGYTYERANILDWFLTAEGAVSPVSGRRLRNARVLPNYALRQRLRQFLLAHEPGGAGG